MLLYIERDGLGLRGVTMLTWKRCVRWLQWGGGAVSRTNLVQGTANSEEKAHEISKQIFFINV